MRILLASEFSWLEILDLSMLFSESWNWLGMAKLIEF